jgi:hypothetical protein
MVDVFPRVHEERLEGTFVDLTFTILAALLRPQPAHQG